MPLVCKNDMTRYLKLIWHSSSPEIFVESSLSQTSAAKQSMWREQIMQPLLCHCYYIKERRWTCDGFNLYRFLNLYGDMCTRKWRLVAAQCQISYLSILDWWVMDIAMKNKHNFSLGFAYQEVHFLAAFICWQCRYICTYYF